MELPLTKVYTNVNQLPNLIILSKINQIFDKEKIQVIPSRQQKESIYYISPSSDFSLFQTSLVMICIYIYFIALGFILAFGSAFWKTQLNRNGVLILYIVILVIFSVDILISFFRGFYRFGGGMIIKNQYEIVSNYMKGYFLFDLITTICVLLPILINNPQADLVQLVFVLKIPKKFYYQNQLYREFQHRRSYQYFILILFTILDVIIITHFVACLFIGIDLLLYNVGYDQQNQGYFWLSNNGNYAVSLIPGLWTFQYIYGLQYASGTMSTLAPGPTPKNPIQQTFVIIFVLSLIVIITYVTDRISKIIYLERERRQSHESNLMILQNFMNLKQTSKQIKRRVRNFFEFIWEIEGVRDIQSKKQVINKLTPILKQQLYFELINTPLRFMQYFNRDLNLDKQVLLMLNEVMTDTCEILLEPGHIQKNRYIYIFKSGFIKICIKLGNYQNQSEHIFAFSNNQKVYGSYQFITDQDYLYTIESIALSYLFRLQLSKFMELIQNYGINQQFHELKHKLAQNHQYELIGRKCLLCFSSEHIQYYCPKYSMSQKIKVKVYQKVKLLNMRRGAERSIFKLKKLNKQFELQKKKLSMAQLNQTHIQRKLQIDHWNNYEGYYPDHNINSIDIE